MKKSILITSLAFLLLACGQVETKSNSSFPERLTNVVMHYTYSGGNGYAVKFEKEGLSYQYRTGSSPETWWGPFTYDHMITEKGEHFISWFEPGYGDYVTLLVNFEDDILYGSAIIKGKKVHFQKAKISKIQMN
jgi:hypothetical protein